MPGKAFSLAAEIDSKGIEKVVPIGRESAVLEAFDTPGGDSVIAAGRAAA